MDLAGLGIFKSDFAGFWWEIVLHPDMPFRFIIFIAVKIAVCILFVSKMGASDFTQAVNYSFATDRTITVCISFSGRFSI